MDEMSFDVVDDLNWLAVVVATAVYYLLAAPWFADPLFGPAWRRSIGWDKRAGEPRPRLATAADARRRGAGLAASSARSKSPRKPTSAATMWTARKACSRLSSPP
jgi:hypothetical protein